MLAHEAAALAAVRLLYGEPIIYTRKTGGLPLAISAIPSIGGAAPAFQGAGDTLRETAFEIFKADLPFDPGKGDKIEHAGIEWTILQKTSLDDVASWSVQVER
ncbi:hypothetical protein ABC347_10920 [Sphingomonas sp. 1P06PA]|uniref:hypothetical protein n=1 Tax=Sphingomonas sp. 1P06PA TaxID=554121 RepID=UPI0039A765AF